MKVIAPNKKSLIYFDNTYPKEWLEIRVSKLNIDSLDFISFRNKINSQRAYLSDFIPYNISQHGYSCSNILCDNTLFLKKANQYYRFNDKRNRLIEVLKQIVNTLRFLIIHQNYEKYIYEWKLVVLDKIIKIEKPSFIIVREPISIPSIFWKKYKGISKIIAYIGVNTSHPKDWNPFIFNGIVTLIPVYKDFYNLQGIKSTLFTLGVDQRVFDELNKFNSKKYDITFIGLLGTKPQENKTKTLEIVALNFPVQFKWWAPNNVDSSLYPNLHKTYCGITAGIEMLQILKESKIALNLYVETSGSLALNMRMYEIFNVGTFPLVLDADNINNIIPGGLIETFYTPEDCVKKIQYWLCEKNEIERETRAKMISQYALKNLSYYERVKAIVDLMKELDNA